MGYQVSPLALFLAMGLRTCVFYGHFASARAKTQSVPEEKLNDTPIIGVVSQEMDYEATRWTGQYHSYIPASYIKFVEGGGARATPIW